MKKGMIYINYVFIDLEMNTFIGKNNHKCQEIIQIGAVKLNENLEEIDSFDFLVKNSKKISKEVLFLTKVCLDDLKKAENFEIVFNNFLNWLGEDYIVLAWSDNDLKQIKNEIKVKKILNNDKITYLLNHFYDFQKEFCDLLNLKSRVISLDLALSLVGFEFEGKRHNALFDARNTSYLYKISRDKKNFKKEMENVKDILSKDKKEKNTIKDLIGADVLENLKSKIKN